MSEREEVLPGGNVAGIVVRIGETVRKPATPATAGVEALLEHLAAVGFAAAPRSFGRDADGRQILEYIPGEMADTMPAFTAAELHRLGRMIRELHSATATFQPPPGVPWWVLLPADQDELFCHHDLAPWNLVRDGDRWVFIDWDGAGPGSRLWDLSYAAQSFTPLHAGGDPVADAARLRVLVDGYGADDDQRRQLPALIEGHTRGMYDLLIDGARTGRQPWARLHADGHAQHWGPAADYIAAHADTFMRALLT